MHGISVGGRVNRDGRQTHLLAGPVDPEGNLAAISYQYLVKHVSSLAAFHFEQWLAEFDGFSILNQDLDNLACDVRFNLVHHLHRFNDADD